MRGNLPVCPLVWATSKTLTFKQHAGFAVDEGKTEVGLVGVDGEGPADGDQRGHP